MDKNSSMNSVGSVPRGPQMKAMVRRVNRRQWWLWSSTMWVTLLLTAGIASFVLPDLLTGFDSFHSFFLNHVVRGLIGLVLLLDVYVVYEQLQINRIRGQLTEQIYNLAFLDPLTGLFNRRYAEQRLEEEIARSQRQGYPLTVILFDLDSFKQVNDSHGHSVGDSVLREFADRLKKTTRGSDLAARYGGDEFLAVLADCNTDGVQYLLKRLDSLQVEMNGENVPVRYSAGWTDYIAGESIEAFLKRADMALYANKRSSEKGALVLSDSR